jgi:hypothetical protein
MECTGELKAVSRDLLSKKWQITFETDQDPTGNIPAMQGKKLSIKAVQYRKKRSLDANAYYWLLIGKLSAALRISTARMHNIMLSRHPHQEVIDGRIVYIELPDTDEAAERAIEAETFHIRPTSRVLVKDGRAVRDYEMLRGSHTYDTAEMSDLINDLVDECRHQGIETLPPDELHAMMAAYEQNWRKKHGDSLAKE